MLHELLRLKITDSDVLVPVDVVAGLLVVWALVVRPWSLTKFLVRIGAMVAGAVVGLGLVWWFGDVQDAFGVAFTPITRMWVALAVAGIALVLAAGLGVNVDFGFYKDVQQALVTNPYPYKDLPVLASGPSTRTALDPSGWRAPAGMPAEGETISVKIPATVSHFHARKAVVWLPPAARTAHPPTLPVMIALSGQPGEPSDLFQTGNMGKYLDRYAAAHDGLAPIVVSPDQLGAPNRNPMCVDSRRLGRSETYVMTDTVDWIRKHLPVAAAPSGWSVAGFSEGATCAMQFSSEFPDVFGSALAISSEPAPLTGSAANSIKVAFDGSAAEYRAAAPAALMAAHGHYVDHLTVFGVGQDDAPYRKSTAMLDAAARKVGISTQVIVSPGSAHDWNTVRYVLAHGLPSVIAHMGLPASGAL